MDKTKKTFRNQAMGISSVILVLLSLFQVSSYATGPIAEKSSKIPIPDEKTWKEIAIVPMPKRIRLTGNMVPLSTGKYQILLGKDASPKARIGADFINRKINKLGGASLPVATSPIEGKLQIIIGTAADNPRIKTAVADGAVDVGPGNPGKKGYEIRFSPDATKIYLGGADDIGTLYACVTFAELMERNGSAITWRQAEVRDWPDFLYYTMAGRAGSYSSADLSEFFWGFRQLRKGKPGAKFKKRFLKVMKAHFDELLRRKVTMFVGGGAVDHYWKNSTPEARAVFKEAMDYGKARGMSILCYACGLSAGPAKGHPELKSKCVTAVYQNGNQKLGEYIRCWCHDDLRKAWAEKLAKIVVEMGFTHIGFHDTDGGGFTNPAMWNARCEECRKRWGDNYGAAVVNKLKIYYRALKARDPNIQINLTQYPYNVGILLKDTEVISDSLAGLPPKAIRKLRKQSIEFWTYLSAHLPKDVTMAIRESRPEALKKWRKITAGRGTLIWFALMSHYWDSFFSEAPSWTESYLKYPDKDIMFPQYAGSDFGLSHLVPLAELEYSWNIKAPGATPWNRLKDQNQIEHCQPKGKIYTVILPHVTENFFGKQAAPYIVRAVSSNVNNRQLMRDPRRSYHLLKTAASMKWQVTEAQKGFDAMNELWEKMEEGKNRLGMTDAAFLRVIIIREAFHVALWVSKIRHQYYLALEAIDKQKISTASREVKKGFEMLAAAKKAFAELVKKRPQNPFWKTPQFRIAYRSFHANSFILEPLEKDLKTVENDVKDILNVKEKSRKGLIAQLSKRRNITAVRTSETIKIDGVLDENIWQKTGPSMPFLVYPAFVKTAAAYTRVRCVYDKDNIYIGFNAYSPSGKISDKDTVEIFLQPSKATADYVHFIFEANGQVRQQQNKEISGVRGLKKAVKDNNWKCKGLQFKSTTGVRQWIGEMRIPFASFTSRPRKKGWQVNYCRICPVGGKTEFSTIMMPGAKTFHDSNRFATLNWRWNAFAPPEVSMNFTNTKVATYTFPDRRATQMEFNVNIDSPVPLTNVTLTAKAYGADGKCQKTAKIADIDYLFPKWKTKELAVIVFSEIILKGGVLLQLNSDQVTSERWYRINGWQGTPQAGEIFPKINGETTALDGTFNFDSFVTLPNKADVKLLNASAGTFEFQFYNVPALPRNKLINLPRCFAHYGPHRTKYPTIYNNSPLCVIYHPSNQSIEFSLKNSNFAGWSTFARGLKDGWNHVACVWNQKAGKKDMLRIYLNGKRASGKIRLQNGKRLKNQPMLDNLRNFNIQIGCFNNGFMPTDRPMRNLRISRTARYQEDFKPSSKLFVLDNQTTALFPLSNNFTGTGMTENNQKYTIGYKIGYYYH